MSWVAFFAKLTQPNFGALVTTLQKPILLTISFSHYVEFARWSLQLMGKSFEEYGYAPVQHVFPILATRLKGKGQNTAPADDKEKKPKMSSMTSAPALVLPNGELKSNSWDIATWAGLDPPEEALEYTLDTIVGPLSRHICYYYLLRKSNENVIEGMFLQDNHLLWRLLWNLGLKSIILNMMRKSFDIDNETKAQESREKLKEAIDIIARDYLNNRKGKYITGNKLTQADIALAALIAPVTMPPEYCLGKFRKWFDQGMAQDEELRREVEYWRATAVGQYTLQLYSTTRTSTTS